MYWRLNSLPELGHLSDEQRKSLLRDNVGKTLPTRLWLTSASRAIILAVAFAFGIALILEAFQASSAMVNTGSIVCFFLFMPLFTCGLYQIMLIRIRGQLREYLLELSTLGIRLPVCVRCGYAIDDIAERCPECGARV